MFQSVLEGPQGVSGGSRDSVGIQGFYRRFKEFHWYFRVYQEYLGVFQGFQGHSRESQEVLGSLRGVSGRSKEDSGASQEVSRIVRDVSGHFRGLQGVP